MGSSKRMSTFAYQSWMVAAGLTDIMSIIMPVGPLFIIMARLTFFMNGYAGGAMFGRTSAMALIETVPAVSIVPACMMFIWMFHRKNRRATKKKREGQAYMPA